MVGKAIDFVWAPNVDAYLTTTWGASGWILIGVVLVAAAICAGPAASAPRRLLAGHST